MDGTFMTCPALFSQLYTIHGVIGRTETSDKTAPLIYGLLSHKSHHCYVILLEIIRTYVLNEMNIALQPKVILTDFETAAIKAVKTVFPETAQKGCFFHLTQNIWKHVQSAGLSQIYGQNSDFANRIRHLAALAYLSPEEIPPAFRLVEEQVLPKDAEEVSAWFKKYYVEGSYTKQRDAASNCLKIKKTPPTFAPPFWSVASSIEIGVPITQNCVEIWHHRWNALLGRKKWNIYKTFEEILKEQKTTIDTIEKIIGQQATEPKRRKTQQDKEEKIKKLLQKKETMDLLSYLRGLSYVCYLKNN